MRSQKRRSSFRLVTKPMTSLVMSSPSSWLEAMDARELVLDLRAAALPAPSRRLSTPDGHIHSASARQVRPGLEVRSVGRQDLTANARCWDDDEHVGQVIAWPKRTRQADASGEQTTGGRPILDAWHEQTVAGGGSMKQAVQEPALLGRPRARVQLARDDRWEPHLSAQNGIKKRLVRLANGVNKRRRVGHDWPGQRRSSELPGFGRRRFDPRREQPLQVGECFHIMQALQRGHHLLASERQAHRVPDGLRLTGAALSRPCPQFIWVHDQVFSYQPAHRTRPDYTLSRQIIHMGRPLFGRNRPRWRSGTAFGPAGTEPPPTTRKRVGSHMCRCPAFIQRIVAAEPGQGASV